MGGMTKCYNLMLLTTNLTNVCRKLKENGTEQCACWKDLKINHFNVIKEIEDPACNVMQNMTKDMKSNKLSCVEAFRTCKQEEDNSISLINNCMSFSGNSNWNEVLNETKIHEDHEKLMAKQNLADGDEEL